MLIVDTDHLTVIQRETEPAYSALRNRLREALPREVCTTIVNVEEQMRGWLIAAIALSHGAMVLSRNTVDFRRVPGLQVEDWTQ